MRKPSPLTRACPHRWCRPLHRILTAESIVLVVATLIHQPGYLAYLLVVVVLVNCVLSLMARSIAAETATDDLEKIDPIDVRTGWANFAAALDLVFTVLAPFAIASLLQAERNTMITTVVGEGPAAAVVVGVLGSCATVVLHPLAHHLATRPRRRKHVLAPAPD
ncbi:hypothetical protein ACFVZ3_32970 [Kitasatospora purpeofusca]|uniref:hypothetical protein n=1 Tax=Kitasatospora purpeofusca TaxID=67352 RepID=UPI0036CA7AC3